LNTVAGHDGFYEFYDHTGYEAIHRIRKGRARWISGKDIRKQNQFIDKLFDLPA